MKKLYILLWLTVIVICTDLNSVNANFKDGKDSQLPDISFKGTIEFVKTYF